MDVAGLATLAANSVVAAAATDAFEGMRDRVARLLGRGKVDPVTDRRLEIMRAELSVVSTVDAARVKAAQQVQWQVRFADLLDTYPEAVAELTQLVAELQTQLPVGGNVTNVITGGVQHGPVIMGRDFTGITLNTDPGSSA
jgi:hypothetical protein